MAEVSFDDLIAEAKKNQPEKQSNPSDVSFDDLIAEAKKKPKKELYQPKGPLYDIPHEIGEAFTEGARNATHFIGQDPKRGQLERFLNAPRTPLGMLQMAWSPVTGTARSVGGHALAGGLSLLGKALPEPPGGRPSYAQMYDEAKPGIDTALSALGVRGPAGGRPPPLPPELVPPEPLPGMPPLPLLPPVP